jgi:hypothetical protein
MLHLAAQYISVRVIKFSVVVMLGGMELVKTSRSRGGPMEISNERIIAFQIQHANLHYYTLGLKSYLASISPTLFKLYTVMQTRGRPPSALELQIAEAHLPLGDPIAQHHLHNVINEFKESMEEC